MKAHWNKRSPFSTLAQTLLMLCCIVLLIPQAAQAQKIERTTDENGRAFGTQPGAVVNAQPAARPTDPVGVVCDGDGGACPTIKAVTNSQNDAPTAVDRDGMRTLTGLLSFQIQKQAPANSVFVNNEGDVGIGTGSPIGRFHVVDRAGDEGSDILLLDDNGNLEIGGLLTEASSVLLKEHLTPVDIQEVLTRIVEMPITTWNYNTDDPSIRHMGPMAQDFYAAFGLGKDDQHIAPLDVNGVALAGVQALAQQVQTQAAHIATLEQQNAELLQRLEALEALVRDK